jgi:hypothetical protein
LRDDCVSAGPVLLLGEAEERKCRSFATLRMTTN